MRVLLVQSWLGRSQHPVLPLGLAVLAGALKEHDTRIVDLNLSDEPMELLRRSLKEFSPDVTGFSLRNCDTTSWSDPFSYLPSFFDQVSLAADTLPGTRIIAGGAGFSLFPGEIMENCPGISCGVTGHGEEIIPAVVEEGPTGVLQGGRGAAASPWWGSLELKHYLAYEKNLSAGVEVNRGCGQRCVYCSYPSISGRRAVYRPSRDIIRDIRKLTGLGFSHVFMIAPVFNASRAESLSLVRALRGLGITWEAYHTPAGFDGEYAEALAESGCSSVAFSPDGGTAEQLRRMGKGFSVRQLERAVSESAARGIGVSLNIFPWQSETGTAQMIKAFRRGARWGRLAGSSLRRLRFSMVRKMPGTGFQGARPGLSERVSREQFIHPPPAQNICFGILRGLLERNRL